MQQMWVRSLGGEDTLEEEMAIHFNIVAWKIPWTEETGTTVHGVIESDMTERTCKHLIYIHPNNNVELTAVQDVLCLYIIHICGKKQGDWSPVEHFKYFLHDMNVSILEELKSQ